MPAVFTKQNLWQKDRKKQGKRRIKVGDALGGQRILISVFSAASTRPDPYICYKYEWKNTRYAVGLQKKIWAKMLKVNILQ